METVKNRRSLKDKSEEEARRWVEGYIQRCRLRITVDELVRLALSVEGTYPGVTRTRVRKARVLLRSRRRAATR